MAPQEGKRRASQSAKKPSSATRKTAAETDRGTAPQTISAGWIGAAIMLSVAGASLCVWGVLCLIFWLGSWQLLYHPKATVTDTPAGAGIAFDSVDFATTESGQPQLHGWWIPAAVGGRITAIYLHGADGNIGNTLGALTALHPSMNLLVFDYRGYGQSRFERPSEERWRKDAEAALGYLKETRHIPLGSIVLIGSGLGANLACEMGAAHPEVAGIVLDEPLISPEEIVFQDPRARLVPARWLVRDRWDLPAAAAQLRVPSLWLERNPAKDAGTASLQLDGVYDEVSARKTRVWVSDALDWSTVAGSTLERWLDDLPRPHGSSTRPRSLFAR